MAELWWVFVVAGIGLIICEIFISGFVIMWFGVAAIITAIPVKMDASTNVIVSVYAISLILLGIFGRRLAMSFFNKGEDDSTKTSTAGYSGSIGIVTEKIGITGIPGRVYVNNESWSAISANGKEIEKDVQVRILKIDGVKVIVEKKES